MLDSEHITDSGHEVRVGQSRFRIHNVKNSMLMMTGKVDVTDPVTGESRTFTTPTPGWAAEAVKSEEEDSATSR